MMANVEITNGSSVTRAYERAGEDTEFLAVFQYSNDAEEFARRKLADDAARDWRDSFYCVCCHYSGKIKLFRHPVTEPVNA